MSLKSSIKSKREKLNDKKYSKGLVSNLIDLVQSSDDQHYINQERIQKRSKYSGKSLNENQAGNQVKGYIPNNFNLSKVSAAIVDNKKLAEKIIYSTQRSSKDLQGIEVVEISDKEDPDQIRERSLFSYKVEGKQGLKYISESHMKGRINAQLKVMQYKERKKTQKQDQEIERIMNGSGQSDCEGFEPKKIMHIAQQKTEQPEEPVERKRAPRYFEQELSQGEEEGNIVKCFRCFKKGHIAKNCLEEEPKQSCNFCSQEHHHSMCNSSPCFRCCLTGHISQDCNSKAIECRKCRKRGHKSQKCGVYIPLEYHNKDEDYIKNRFKKSDLKKLKCLRFCKNPEGHFNCFQYNQTKDPHPYNYVPAKNGGGDKYERYGNKQEKYGNKFRR